MTSLGVDIPALTSAALQFQSAAGDFGRGSGQVAGTAPVPGATPEATVLSERLLAALGAALRTAETELQQVAQHLSATADSYARTERVLAAWVVPGAGTAAAGGR